MRLSYLKKASIGSLVAAGVGLVKVGCLDVVHNRQRSVPALRVTIKLHYTING